MSCRYLVAGLGLESTMGESYGLRGPAHDGMPGRDLLSGLAFESIVGEYYSLIGCLLDEILCRESHPKIGI
jgi:hypothetical protein